MSTKFATTVELSNRIESPLHVELRKPGEKESAVPQFHVSFGESANGVLLRRLVRPRRLPELAFAVFPGDHV